MQYDFDTPINRLGSGSLKWDIALNELPMWVADMDFATAPEIIAAITAKAAHGVFGYSNIPSKWHEAYINWWQHRHGFLIKKDWLIFATGIVPAISSIVRKLTTPAEKVLIQTPVYNIFFNSIINNGRTVLQSPLEYDGNNYTINWADLEQKLADPQTTLMILCNPHNPIGILWDKATLAQIGSMCKKHNVIVISDEIHCDLAHPSLKYTPFASVSTECRDISITCIAPTKAFNLAGLQTAAVVVPSPTLRHKVSRGLNTDEVAEPNAFAIDATVAAFNEGESWLDALKTYIYENKIISAKYIASEIANIKATPSQATYLMWLDCTKLHGTATEIAKFVRASTGLYLSEGGQFGGNGNQFLRMNIACPRVILEDGLSRLKQGIAAYDARNNV